MALLAHTKKRECVNNIMICERECEDLHSRSNDTAAKECVEQYLTRQEKGL